MKRYNPKEIEPKWQKFWEDKRLNKAIDFDSRIKYVMLTEFPYPSGDGLHIGHIREFTYGDIIARQKRLQGYNVLFPMGYDAFGLPTENYAIKNKVSPQVATETNIANFQSQFESMGYSFDWSRSITTSDPKYYKWTQYLFLQFYNTGLAYQDEIAINWCPFCKTGLSNEEVINGRHERCDTIVQKKVIKQWLLRITDFADRLIDGLKQVDYPSRIADQQINWIGKKTGININYKITNSAKEEIITCFTTRPDTNFGATFIVLAPEHEFTSKIIKGQVKPVNGSDHRNTITAYVSQAVAKSEIERQEEGRNKTGVFSGFYVKNDLNNSLLPVWISDFVLSNFGTGAVVAVPAHDKRDYEFAKEFDLDIKRVVSLDNQDDIVQTIDDVYEDKEGKIINSDFLDGLEVNEAIEKAMDYLEEKSFGKRSVSYRLRDWIFSRQHYWGEPIPIIHCPKDGAVAVPEDQLPVELPIIEQYQPTESGDSPLSLISDWVNVNCPICKGPAKRETDTMPNWAGSSWYYLRYYDANNDLAFADRKKLDYWGAVDFYLGGMEHTTLHLLYSRFWHQFFYDQGLVPTPEPYLTRRGQGIILAADGSKMSKSKGNVVNPSDIIDSGYGADAVRLSIAFLAPYDQTTPWNPEGVAGTHRFLNRLWTLVQEYLDNKQGDLVSDELNIVINKTILKVDQDLKRLSFNTSISAMMEAVNDLYKIKAKDKYSSANWLNIIENFLLILSPFAPHICDELWQQIGHDESIHISKWPIYDQRYTVSKTFNLVIQINGRHRTNLTIETGRDEQELIKEALSDPKIKKYLKNVSIKKTIYIKDKLLNIVI